MSKKEIKEISEILGDKLWLEFSTKYPNISIKRLRTLRDIFVLNKEKTIELYEEYYTLASTSSYRAIEIRRGSEAVGTLKNKLKNRPVIDRSAQKMYDPVFISRVRNVSLEDAKIIIQEKKERISTSLKRTFSKNPKTKDSNPLCIEYYEKRNFENPIQSLDKYKRSKLFNSKISYMKRYGSLEKFEERMQNRSKTMIKRYGTSAFGSGQPSKESMIFFSKLHDKLLTSGMNENDFYWGVPNNREFASHHEGKNYFYDFTIRSKKIIVEYNGSFWHPNIEKLDEWRGFGDKYKLLEEYSRKIKHIENRGYKVFVVWDYEANDETVEKLYMEIISL